MKTKLRTYKPKALIDGGAIGEEPGSTWVAVPDKYADVQVSVIYGGASMTIRSWRYEAKQFKRFRDKYWTADNGRQQYYTLGYFKWIPQI